MVLQTPTNEEIECVIAVKGIDYIHLYADENMAEKIACFGGISDFTGYELHGGEWTTPPLTEIEEVQLALAELGELIGGII